MKQIDLKQLQISKTINDDNSTSVDYSIFGKQLLAYEIDTPTARECARLQVIIKDLEIVAASLKLAQTYESTNPNQNKLVNFDHANPEHIILSAIYRSSVITYSKHFTKAKESSPQLHDEQIKPYLDEALFRLHLKIRLIRNNWIAHGGRNEFEIGKTIHIIDPSMEFAPAYFHHALDFATPLNLVVRSFESLTNQVLEVVKNMIIKKTHKLYRTELTKMNPDELVRSHTRQIIFNGSLSDQI